MDEILRGGGRPGESPWRARDVWNAAFAELAQATDSVLEPDERRAHAYVGAKFAKVAYLMERAAALSLGHADPHTPNRRHPMPDRGVAARVRVVGKGAQP